MSDWAASPLPSAGATLFAALVFGVVRFGGAKRRERPEDELQAAVVEFLLLVLGRDYLVLHVPNQGKRSPVVAGILRRMGMRTGCSDLLILGASFSAAVELKAGRGKLSDAQEAFRDDCRRRGIHWALCRTQVEVEDTVVAWGLVRREGRTLCPVPAGGVRGTGREASPVGRGIAGSSAVVPGLPGEDRGVETAD